ncbi:MAG: hypothetical protein K6E92_07245 [Lachnospiraceae bacterium]|nr:hypothetical protein [Lachnospiraceae bacterium]
MGSAEEEKKVLTDEEKRIARHKRRVRTTVFVYLTTLVFVLLLLAGVAYGAIRFTEMRAAKTAAVPVETPQPQPEPAAEPEPVDTQTVTEYIGEEEQLTDPEPEDFEQPPTPEEMLDEIVDAAIQVMPLEDKVAGLFVITPEALTGVDRAVKAGDSTKEALDKYAVGGLLYGTDNIQNAEQFGEMMANTQMYVHYPTFFLISEEGGTDKDLSPITAAGLGEAVPFLGSLGSEGDEAAFRAAGSALGLNLSMYGFNTDLAPIADLGEIGRNLSGRTLGETSETVAARCAQVLEGLSESGVTGCVKYFPTLAAGNEDPAKERALTLRSAEELRAGEFQVYSTLIASGVSMIQMSDLVFPALDENGIPASLCEGIVSGVLRGELGYEGVILSAPLNEETVKGYYAPDEAAILALKAGCDMIVAPEDFGAAYQGVLDACASGVISEERINLALKRIYRIKYADRIEEQAQEDR